MWPTCLNPGRKGHFSGLPPGSFESSDNRSRRRRRGDSGRRQDAREGSRLSPGALFVAAATAASSAPGLPRGLSSAPSRSTSAAVSFPSRAAAAATSSTSGRRLGTSRCSSSSGRGRRFPRTTTSSVSFYYCLTLGIDTLREQKPSIKT